MASLPSYHKGVVHLPHVSKRSVHDIRDCLLFEGAVGEGVWEIHNACISSRCRSLLRLLLSYYFWMSSLSSICRIMQANPNNPKTDFLKPSKIEELG